MESRGMLKPVFSNIDGDLPFLTSLWHKAALYQGNFLP